MKKRILAIALLLISLYTCSRKTDSVNFELNNKEEILKELTDAQKEKENIDWLRPEPVVATPITPVFGNLSLPLTYPLYTLRTEGVGTDFQETESYRKLLYQSLLEYKLTSASFTPILVKRWSYKPRTKAPIYFEIDQRALWSDGSPVKATDVVATFNFLKEEDLQQPEKTDFFKKVQAYALDEYTVKVTMPETDEGSFFRLTSQSIYPEKELALYSAKSYINGFNDKVLMGSGPYILDEKHSLKEKELNFIHKKDYWGREAPHLRNFYNFEKITYRVIQDARVREWSFKEGILDVLPVTSAKSWVDDWIFHKEPLLARGIWQKRKVINSIPHGVSGIAFNLRRPLINDLRIRQALAHLWNRQQVIDSLFMGEYIPTNSFYPHSVYANPRNPVYPYEPEKASQILSNLRYHLDPQDKLLKDSKGNTLDLELLITSRETPFFQQFVADVRKIGINLKVTVLPNNALQLRLIDHDFDMAYTGFRGVLFPRPDLQFVSKIANDKNSLNIWGLKDPKIDQLLANYTQKSLKEQIKIIHQLDCELAKKLIFIYSWHSPYANRIIYWNKFNQPLGLFGEYGNYYSITKYWSINPLLAEKIAQHKTTNICLPVGEEVYNYYQQEL